MLLPVMRSEASSFSDPFFAFQVSDRVQVTSEELQGHGGQIVCRAGPYSP